MNERLVIVPTYNEIENIGKIVEAVLGLPIKVHLLIVDDNSPDGTGEHIRKLQEKHTRSLHLIERSGKLGLGTAYIMGFKWALERGYLYICEMDADFSHNPNDLPRLFEACHENSADMAIGSRYVSGVNVVNWPMSRVLISYFASVYVRMITRMKVRDATAGFVCYRKEVLEVIDLDMIRFKGYAFQIEMKFKAWKYGFNVVELPIIFTDRKEGTSKMSGKIVSEAIFGVIRLKISSWFRRYRRTAPVTAESESL
ncbi:MAG: polyprenol monophosphomannose synthase [Bacteroidales bacterium]|nr:polyprenol monophosphomannose synthase [Bacteroidales bacterium]